jgi:hypothetical protein
MLKELQRLNYSEETIRSYIHAVEDFSRREYQAELFHKRKLSAGSVAVRFNCPRTAWVLGTFASCDPHLHQAIEQPTLSYLTRSVRRRAATSYAGQVQQLGGANPLPNLMEVKG